MKNIRAFAAVLATCGLFSACGGNPTGPTPVTAPPANTRRVLRPISGSGPNGEIMFGPGYQGFGVPAKPDSIGLLDVVFRMDPGPPVVGLQIFIMKQTDFDACVATWDCPQALNKPATSAHESGDAPGVMTFRATYEAEPGIYTVFFRKEGDPAARGWGDIGFTSR